MAEKTSADPVASDPHHSRLDDRRTLERVTFRTSDEQLAALETLVEEEVYHTRSEAIRAGIQRLLERHGADDSDGRNR
ncbi:ribbon-helix-helix domain-containing protein [Natrialbaceae archaeon GCM10025810]|uniref:ribbon-helix-helix domain-containing protein n=1 Tax=Halovalidus salilacus TaxID=3075124 RepID=UPI00360889E3